MELERLKEYLQKLYLLEKSIYVQRKMEEKIDEKLSIYQKGLSVLNDPPRKSDGTIDVVAAMVNQSILEQTPYKKEIKEKRCRSYTWLWEWDIKYFYIASAVSVLFLLYSISLAIFVFLSVFIGYSIIIFIKWINEYQMIKQKNKMIREQNAIISSDNQRYLAIRNIQMKNMQQEKNYIQANIRQTWRILQNYYQIEIIHKKYRHNFVAISFFYEYFDTDKCTSLEGHEGAYSVYENEIFQNKNQIKNAMEYPEQIRHTHYRFYEAIIEANKVSEKVIQILTRSKSSLQNFVNINDINLLNAKFKNQNEELLKLLEKFKI